MKIFYSCLILASMLMASCTTSRVTPNSNFVTFEIAANDVTAIDAAASIKVVYTQSPDVAVTVTAPDNIVDLLDVRIKNGELCACFKSLVSINGSSNVIVNVSSPSLREINASSSGSVIVPSGIKLASKINVEASSAGKIQINGLECAYADIESSSSAKVEITGLIAEGVVSEATSSAKISLTDVSLGRLSAEASSAAKIILSGKCTSVDFDASSAGLISASNLHAAKGNADASSAGKIESDVEKLYANSSSAGVVNNR